MAGDSGGSWLNPFDNLAHHVGNTLGTSATAASGTYDNSSYTPSYQTQPTSSGGTVLGTSTDPYAGSIYYDTNTGSMQQYDGNGQYSDASAGGGEGTYSEFNTDPYAQWGGQQAYNDLLSGYQGKEQGIYDSAGTAAQNTALGLKGGIRDFMANAANTQNRLNLRGSQSELAKMRGAQDIRGMVGQGIKSGANMLANRNAGDSSAAGAIARAYAQIGADEMRGVNSQYSDQMAELNLSQQELAGSLGNFREDYEEQKVTALNDIVNDVQSQLTALDAQMAEADMMERIAIEQEKNRVKGEAKTTLAQFDKYFDTQKGNVKSNDKSQRKASAAEMLREGAGVGGQSVDYSTDVPMQFQGTGPFATELPIFTSSRARKER